MTNSANTPSRKANVLLLGPIGTGKTTSIKTLLDAGQEVFVLATEPGLLKILGDTDETRCHWHYIPPAAVSWETMARNAKLINTCTPDVLQKQTGGRQDYRQFIEVLDCCSNFVCDRTGKSFGAVDSWDDTRTFVIDSLSGLSIMAMDLVVGAKPVKTQPEWGIAMDNLERFITKCCCDTRCSFVLTAHFDREVDEVAGGTKLMPSTLGRKLAPKIPRYFDEVVQCIKSGKNFYWSTSEAGTDLKTRVLENSSELKPTFVQLFPKVTL